MRNVIFSSVILTGLLMVPIADGHYWSPAAAAEPPTLIENAPCGWFTSVYPGAWSTDHKILINPRIVIEKMSFGRGTHQLVDGTDAYDYLERRCSK